MLLAWRIFFRFKNFASNFCWSTWLYLKWYFFVTVVEGRNLPVMDSTGKSDPYCIVIVGNQERRTSVQYSTINPTWHEALQFDISGVPQLMQNEPGEMMTLIFLQLYNHYSYEFWGNTLIALKNLSCTQIIKKTTKYSCMLHFVISHRAVIKFLSSCSKWKFFQNWLQTTYQIWFLVNLTLVDSQFLLSSGAKRINGQCRFNQTKPEIKFDQ